jgi:phosphatidate cytidylyltransferase
MATGDTVGKKEAQDRSNLIVRSITALVGGPLVLIVVYLGGWPFVALAFFLAAMSLLEFYALGTRRGIQGNFFVGIPFLVLLVVMVVESSMGQALNLILLFVGVGVVTYGVEALRRVEPSQRLGRTAVTMAGLAYAGFPAGFLIGIRTLPDGLIWILFLVCVTWGTDTLAYLGGRWWGKTPLAPRISPKKTREGALTGVVFGIAAGTLVLILGGKFNPGSLLLALLMPPAAVVGDLFESGLKRFFYAGDSHLAGLNLIPGHGGVLDRTDSLVWVTTLCYIYLLLMSVT